MAIALSCSCRLFRLFFLFLFAVAGTMHAEAAPASGQVTLAAGERAPYIGKALPENGYVAELAREAFRRRGYSVNIEFYPLARARMLASKGTVDGMLPTFRRTDAASRATFVYSDPFPGDTIGLLKKKSLPFSYSGKELEKEEELLRVLRPYRIGTVRDGPMLPMLEKDAAALQMEMVSEDLRNLDKLAAGRIQLALIDKYTAADLIVGQRPHLIGEYEFMRPALAHRNFHIAFPVAGTRHRELVDAFDAGLAEMAKDGSLEAILKKHGLFPSVKGDGKKRLLIGTVNNPDMAIMQKLAAEFEKEHPDIELEWRVLDENILRLRLLSDLAIADGQFDILTIGSYETPLWAKRGWLSAIRPPESYDLDDILVPVRAAMSHEGQLFALPFYAESSMTFYRKDLFAKAGLTMPARPSYDDIRRFAARLHDPEAGLYGVCLRGTPGWGENMTFLTTMANAYGGRWFDAGWRPELDSPAWARAVAMYQELLGRYGPPRPERNGFNENLALFADGRCAIWIDATVAAGVLFDSKRSKVASQLGFVHAPSAVTDKGAAWLWTWALAIPNTSFHKKEAEQFILWATSKRYIRRVADRYGWVAVPPGTRRSTYANDNYLKAAPFAGFVREAIEKANMRDSTLLPKPYIGIQFVGIPEFAAMGTHVGYEMAKMLRGDQTAKDALARSQQLLLEQMRLSGYIKREVFPPWEKTSMRRPGTISAAGSR